MLFIYCAGSLGKEIYDLALRTKYKESEIVFVDDNKIGEKFTSDEIDIISNETLFKKFSKEDRVLIATGEPALREKLYNEIKSRDLIFDVLIDPNVPVSKSAKINNGTIICDFCSISSDVIIAENVLINRQAIIGHDIEISSNSVISSNVNLGGNVKVGSCSYIGMGAQVKEGIKIGSNSIVAMGAVLIKDVPDGIIAVGNPARPILKNIDRKVFK